jgi:hypothetical protein
MAQEANRMTHRLSPILAALALVAGLAPLAGHAQVTFVTAKLNGDDQFKLYLSTLPTNDGFQFANGYGWPATYTATMLLPLDSTGKHDPDYWINLWIQDVGGGGPDVLGQFRISGAPSCRFDNGTTTLLTDATSGFWQVTKPLPASPGGPPIPGYPTWATNYLPPYVPPSLPPLDLGPNGVAPWGLMPAISAAARWMSDPFQTSFAEAWFQAHIHCKK